MWLKLARREDVANKLQSSHRWSMMPSSRFLGMLEVAEAVRTQAYGLFSKYHRTPET